MDQLLCRQPTNGPLRSAQLRYDGTTTPFVRFHLPRDRTSPRFHRSQCPV